MPFIFILLDVSGTGKHDRSPVQPERQARRERGRGAGRGVRCRQYPAEPHIDWSDQYILQCRSLTLESHILVQQEDF